MMFNSPPQLTRKLLPALIASAMAASVYAQTDVVINNAAGIQGILSDSTSVTVTGTLDSYLSGDGGTYDDGLILEGGGHNLTFINVEQGASIIAGWDAIYTGDEGANTVGSITIDGDLFSEGYIGGTGVSVDHQTTVTGDVLISETGSFTGRGTDPGESNSSYQSGVEQTGIGILGSVSGDVSNAGTITAANGLTVLGASFSEGSLAGTVGGDVTNAGTINASGDAGILVLGGGSVAGSLVNNGTINASGSGAGISVTSKVLNLDNFDVEVDGFVDGSAKAVVSGSIINNDTINAEFDGIGLYDNVSVGSVINTGSISSFATDGDAAAIYIGDDSDSADGLPTVMGGISNSGTLISDSSNQLADDQGTLAPAMRTATVELHTASSVAFINYTDSTIENRDAQGNAIRSSHAESSISNFGNITGAVRMSGGEFYNAGEVTGAVYMGGGVFSSTGGTSGSIIDASSLILAGDGQGGGVTTINGDFIFSGELLVFATPETGMGFTSNSSLSVTGDADLTGTSLTVVLTPGGVTAEGDEFSFVSAGGALVSDIDQASGVEVETEARVVSFTVEQRGNELFAIAGASDFATDSVDDFLQNNSMLNNRGGKNLTNVADALSNVPLADLDPSSRLGQAISALQGGQLQGDSYAKAIASLDPETVEGSSVGSLQADNAAASSIDNRTAALRGYYGYSGAVAGDSLGINGFWLQGYANQTDQGFREGIDGFEADTQGFGMGLDAPVGERFMIGGALSYANTDVDMKRAKRNGMEIDSFRLTAYGSYNADTYYLDTQIAYAKNQYDSRRLIDPSLTLGSVVVARGDHDGDQYNARFRGGYPIALESGWFVTPTAELNYTYLTEDGFSEKGAGNLGLSMSTSDVEVLVLGVGVKVAYPFTTSNDFTLIPEFSLDYQYDTIGDEVEIDSNFAGVTGAAFITEGANVEQEAIKASARLRGFNQGNYSFAVAFDYIEKQDYDSQSLSATVRYDF